MLNLKMQFLVNKEKLKFLIWKHVKSAGEQVQSQVPDPKLVQLVGEADKLEEPQELLLVILRK